MTVNPMAPSMDWKSGWSRAWELAGDMYGEDGKLGSEFVEKYIRNGWLNYL